MDELETLDDLRNYLQVVLPDIHAYHNMSDVIFDSLTEAILEKFGNAGLEVLQIHDHAIHHASV